MESPFPFILAIIAIVSVVKIIRFRMGDKTAFDKPWMSRSDRGRQAFADDGQPDGETRYLRDEVKQLKGRIHVLERIAVDKENSLARQIDELRDGRP